MNVTINNDTSDIAGWPEVANHGLYELIATGSSATVWRAKNQVLSASVAIKVAHRRGYELGNDRHQNFIDEALLLRQCSHPNLMPVHEVGLTSEVNPFFTMPLASKTLSSVGTFTENIAALQSVALALEYLHDRGIIHCDVKPSNVLYLDNASFSRWVLSDLGLAWHSEKPRALGSGTYGYVAPECYASDPPSVFSDRFSFARLAQTVLIKHCKKPAGANSLSAVLASSLDPEPRRRNTGPIRLVETIHEFVLDRVESFTH